MSEYPVNCGRCAHLWNRAHPGFGVCACHARQELTGKIRPYVSLDSTCEHAQISAKFDPDFIPQIIAARRGFAPQPSILSPIETTPQPTQ